MTQENLNEESESEKEKITGKTILKEKIAQKENQEKKKMPKLKKEKTKEKEMDKNEYIEIKDENLEDGKIGKKKNHKKKGKKNDLHVLLKENKEFENNIIEAYKQLSKTNIKIEESLSKEEQEDNEDENSELQKNLNLKFCEKKLRSALNICENDPSLIINRNIIDKISRISVHDKMNLNYIIGDIYISLMNKESLLDYDSKDFEINDLLLFINKVIQFKEIIENTKIEISYNDTLVNFLKNITEEFDLGEEQLKSINEVLESNKQIEHNDIMTEFIGDLTITLFQELEKQPNIYEQYKIFIQNKSSIIKLIKNSDLNEKKNYNNYLKLGKFLAYLFYNKTFTLYLEGKEKEKDSESIRFTLYDGYENKDEINVINGEDFYIYEDEKILELKKNICEIIFEYIEKFINMDDSFPMLYIIYILTKRIYFFHYIEYEKKIIPLLADSLINMCFFKDSPLLIIKEFINKIIKSTKKENLEFKKLLLEKINKVKNNKKFLYKLPKSFTRLEVDRDINSEDEKEINNEEEEEESSYEEEDINGRDKGLNNAIEEVILLYNNELTIGFLNLKKINAGENFIFYEEINQEYSILEFYLDLVDLDINLTITDLTEGREIFSKEKLKSFFETPLKIIMFFSNPRILKFELDNTYSWIRAKTIKYKTNIFYPKNPYSLGSHISLNKYKKIILQTKDKTMKNTKGKKETTKGGNKLLICKINDENKVFNCINVKQNLNAINKMVKDKYLYISSIFLKINNNIEKGKNLNNEDKSYFYYYKENEGLIENDLTQEKLEQYLHDILIKSEGNFNIINLYIINGNSTTNIHYSSIKKLLGFEPVIKFEGINQKILFFIQYLNQAQLLYYLYKQIYNQEPIDIVLLINYSKHGGYQAILFQNEEITNDLNDFRGLNKNSSFEENYNVIFDGIKKLGEDEGGKIDIILTSSIDEEDNEIKKLEEKLKENMNNENDKNKKNINIIKMDLQFNNELQINSHIFYLDK